MPSVPVEQIKKAVSALNAFVKGDVKPKNGKKEKASLFDREEEYQLIITLRKIPQQTKNKPIRIPMPHSYHGREGAKICLFTKDTQAEFEALLERNPVKNVKAVISVSTLRKDYAAFQHRRELLSQFDFFMADDRVLTLLPNLIGKNFFNAKKQPVPVDISKNFKKDIIAARDSTYLFLSQGVTCNLRLGDQDFTIDQITENANAVLNQAVTHIPRGWKNIQAVYLKTTNSAALPIYNALSTVEDFLPTEQELEATALETKIREVRSERRQAEKHNLTLSEYRRFQEMAEQLKVPFKTVLLLRKQNQLPNRKALKSIANFDEDMISAEFDEDDEDLEDMDGMEDMEDLYNMLLEEDMDVLELGDEDEEEEEEAPAPAPVVVSKKRAAPEPVVATKTKVVKTAPEPVKAAKIEAPATKKQKVSRK